MKKMRSIKKLLLCLVAILIIQLPFLVWPKPAFAGGCVSPCAPFMGDLCMCEWCQYLGFPYDVDFCILNFCPCGGCFSGETEIGMLNQKSGTEQIKELEPGEIVSSFDPETGEIKENTVSRILKFTREEYYELETESGKKVKVTAEHPFLAVKNTNNKSSIIDILSHTLTYKLITGLQAKIAEAF